jgi:hypothetical protein
MTLGSTYRDIFSLEVLNVRSTEITIQLFKLGSTFYTDDSMASWVPAKNDELF